MSSSRSYLEFVTPTAVDLRELVTLGLGSKRGVEGKIGHKGSGMKFTLALLHRLGSSLTVLVGGRVWSSKVETAVIRGSDHQLIYLEADDGERMDASISVNAGADTWTQPWFALRELLQNSIDEKGTCYTTTTGTPAVRSGGTTMRVLLTEHLGTAWDSKHLWFQPRTGDLLYESNSPGLFYHGFKIYDGGDKWRFTYDVTDLLDRENLSEDRQIRNVNFNQLFGKLVQTWPRNRELPLTFYHELMKLNQATDVQMICAALSERVSRAEPFVGSFKLATLEQEWIGAYGEKSCWTTSRVDDSQEKYFAEAAGYRIIPVGWSLSYILGCSRITAAESLVPALAARLQQRKVSDLPGDAVSRLKEAIRITKRIRPDGCTIVVVSKLAGEQEMNTAALADQKNNRVLILDEHVERSGVPELTDTLVEEYMHLRSGASDLTRDFEKALIAQIAALLTPRRRALADTL